MARAHTAHAGTSATTHAPSLTVRPLPHHVLLLCLSGRLDTTSATTLAHDLDRYLQQTATTPRQLVLDMTDLAPPSTAALHALDERTRHLAHTPVPIITNTPRVQQVFALTPPPGLRVHPTLAAALAALPTHPPLPTTAQHDAPCQSLHEGPPAGLHREPYDNPRKGPREGLREGPGEEPREELQIELYGMRAKSRTSAVIGIAQGMLLDRYDLTGPPAAFALLREASQQHNVPMRILASAVVTAPAPASDTAWFPGRLHTPPPRLDLLEPTQTHLRDRHQVLRTLVYEAITLADADAAEVHLTNRAFDDALILEAHAGLTPAYRDRLALVTGPPALCAQACTHAETRFVPDITADPDLAAAAEGRAALAAGTRALYAVPAITDAGHCIGTITVHRTHPGPWLTHAQQTALHTLATDLAIWRSWYGRTVVLDALEHLHTHAPGAVCRSGAPSAPAPPGPPRPHA
ncbi:GAF domain-containing protein [Streptomyces collinus]|uniref:GAF domain-containing protein n=1 Tax=Streptomyces collinus TaxID=42684 RepID=UPI0034037114